MAEASPKIAKPLENIIPHNTDLRPQYKEVKIFNVRRSLLSGYEGFSRPFKAPVSFRIYGSRGEIALAMMLSLYGLYSLKSYVGFQKQAKRQTRSRHQYSMVSNNAEKSSLEDLGERVPTELLHLWK